MKVSMRKDLAKRQLSVPAGIGYSGYDTLEDVLYLTADDLQGSVVGPDKHGDAHPFCRVKLSNQMLVYMHSSDLDFHEDEMEKENEARMEDEAQFASYVNPPKPTDIVEDATMFLSWFK